MVEPCSRSNLREWYGKERIQREVIGVLIQLLKFCKMNELKLSHFQNVSVDLKFPTSHNIMHVTLYTFILMLIIYL